ncbi:PH domain-containing protein [Natronobeatus ordinarius]|uniref:PH domain-containing protein n=1 Tax=Natronobeatus ordinarius TaxID=2963433 RepID=UPI0020CE754A|nr:PH domain-containing protein [Natronobeatus ordinarius]
MPRSQSTSAVDRPNAPGSPDVAFVAATGVYAAVALVGATVAAALTLEASTATIVGSIASAATVGLLVGAVGSSRLERLPERLGSRPRSPALPFVPPVAFALATVAVLTIPSLPAAAAAGTGFGAVGGLLAADGIASMARTRYARALTPDEPRATIPRLAPGYHRRVIGFGLGCLVVAVVIFLVGAGARYRPPGGSRTIAGAAGATFVVGVSFVFAGFSQWLHVARDADENGGGTDDGLLHSLLPDRQRRVVFGAEWSQTMVVGADPSAFPELRVHDRGLVVTGPRGERFVPWTAVTDVSLTPDLLVVERAGGDPIRCRRSVIDDPERALEFLERARSDAEATSDAR